MPTTPQRPHFRLFDTPLGIAAITWTRVGVRRVHLPEPQRATLLDKLKQLPADPCDEPVPRHIERIISRLTQQLAGKSVSHGSLKLDTDAVSPFRMRVYRALQQVPAGRTVSYGELAALAGSPGAARAVGSAMASNPWPLLVPCHRVLAAGGKLGGFTAHDGVITKRKLLAMEGSDPTAAPSLLDGRGDLPYDVEAATTMLRAADRKLARWMDRVGPFTMKLKPKRTVFAALSEAIVYQQLSGKAAGAIYARVQQHLAGKRALRASDVVKHDVEQLRALGLSRAKARALLDLAEKSKARKLPSRAALTRMADDEVVKQLTLVRGVGPWTVHMLLLFQLGRPDVLASGDYGLRKGLGVMLKRVEVPSADEFERYSERWKPYRSVASWYMWRLLEV